MDDVKCYTCQGKKTISTGFNGRRINCLSCSGSGIDWRKTCEAIQQETEVLRYDLKVAHSVINSQKPDFDAERLRADTAEAERDVLRHEVNCRVQAEVGAIEALLAAEQRIAERDALIADVLKAFRLDEEGRGSCTNPGYSFIRPWSDRVAAISTASPATINQQGEVDG